jgi:hypothetical protein
MCEMKKRKWDVLVGFGLAAALMLPATVSAGLVDGTEISEPNSFQAAPLLAPAPLAKVNTSTRTSYTIAFGSCPGTVCNVATCTTVTFSSGTVNFPGLGKSALAGCISFETNTQDPNGTGGLCDASSGTATVTGASGSITLGLGGNACNVPPGALVTETSEMNLVYIVTGGTAKFVTASGVGDFTGSVLTTTGIPGPGTGIIEISGTFAPH